MKKEGLINEVTLEKGGEVELELEALGFCGFYESSLWNSDSIEDDINWLLDNEGEESDLDKVDDLYYSIDAEKYQQEISEYYMEEYIDSINRVYPDLLKSIPEAKVEVSSPAYYNYSTDRIFQKVKLNTEKLKELHREAMASPKFEATIKETFTPRMGYMPLLSDRLSDWKEITQLDTTELNVLLNMQADLKLREQICGIKTLCELRCEDTGIRPIDYIDQDLLYKIIGKEKEVEDQSLDQSSTKSIVLTKSEPKKGRGI
ncbi:hypothetical protein [uncultured Porphyromonas sp.]|uniref:hypothetical protein n=1 Tax=uncultured Porphyromonas sp. TaxID=159274 RepID=UPI00259BEDEA|nr:hypothetical protein [uncultured Porphyromonas sp.]